MAIRLVVSPTVISFLEALDSFKDFLRLLLTKFWFDFLPVYCRGKGCPDLKSYAVLLVEILRTKNIVI